MSKVNDITNITLPVYKRLKKDIESSTEIVKAIKFDSSTYRITFPKGIVPLKIKLNMYGSYVTRYFDYSQMKLLSDTGESTGFDISYSNNCLQLDVDSRSTGQINAIEYIPTDSFDEDVLNTYYLYNAPLTLYKHKIKGFTIYQGCDIYFISTSSTPCSSSDYQALLNLIGTSLGWYITGGGRGNIKDRYCAEWSAQGGSSITLAAYVIAENSGSLSLSKSPCSGTYAGTEVSLF